MTPLLTPEEVASLLRISLRTVGVGGSNPLAPTHSKDTHFFWVASQCGETVKLRILSGNRLYADFPRPRHQIDRTHSPRVVKHHAGSIRTGDIPLRYDSL
jgi:hypothetical protein